MTAQPTTAPIIIKRKKVIAGGHHGGAWKVAYADFVTAMMAFFLLMWLLGATNEKQRKGIADYFNPTIPINKVSGGGDGAFGGESVFSENTLTQSGTGAAMMLPTETSETGVDVGEGDGSESEAHSALSDIATKLPGSGGESMVSELLARHIVSRLSDEGLIVELFDTETDVLFDADSVPTPLLGDLIAVIAEVFQLAENEIAIQIHTASAPLVLRENPVWTRSAARANSVHQMIRESGLDPDRIQRVSSFADRKLISRDPLSVRNNRIELILLRDKL